MRRLLLSDDVITALVDAVGPVHMPDGQIRRHESDAVEGHEHRPDDLEIRRRQRELEQRDMTRRGGGRR